MVLANKYIPSPIFAVSEFLISCTLYPSQPAEPADQLLALRDEYLFLDLRLSYHPTLFRSLATIYNFCSSLSVSPINALPWVDSLLGGGGE